MSTVRYSLRAEIVNDENGGIETVDVNFDPSDAQSLMLSWRDLWFMTNKRLSELNGVSGFDHLLEGKGKPFDRSKPIQFHKVDW